MNINNWLGRAAHAPGRIVSDQVSHVLNRQQLYLVCWLDGTNSPSAQIGRPAIRTKALLNCGTGGGLSRAETLRHRGKNGLYKLLHM